MRDSGLRREALVSVGAAALGLGVAVRGYHSSGLPGPKGNRETFIWLVPAGARHRRRRDRRGPQTPAALEDMAREVEP